ncbi:MAG: hypothetical protein CMI54_07700 [Parcubacteria group bacterium]|nr:hypothetical protein [Parcubacteria group bacterium]|tara:strand:+ start:7403 stop:8080 length:678 start_codon:yes stop_codon:yes gene_type:complete
MAILGFDLGGLFSGGAGGSVSRLFGPLTFMLIGSLKWIAYLSPFYAMFHMRRHYKVFAFVYKRLGNTDVVHPDFGRVVKDKDKTTGVVTERMKWLFSRRVTPKLPYDTLYAGKWNLMFTQLRQGVNGELLPMSINKGEKGDHLNPRNQGIELWRRNEHKLMVEKNTAKEDKWWQNPHVWNLTYMFVAIFGVWLLLDQVAKMNNGFNDAANAMQAMADSFKALAGG